MELINRQFLQPHSIIILRNLLYLSELVVFLYQHYLEYKTKKVFQNGIKCKYKKHICTITLAIGFNFKKRIILYIKSLNKHFIKMKEVLLYGKSLFYDGLFDCTFDMAFPCAENLSQFHNFFLILLILFDKTVSEQIMSNDRKSGKIKNGLYHCQFFYLSTSSR